MQLIENKKGNVGYTLSGWNCSLVTYMDGSKGAYCDLVGGSRREGFTFKTNLIFKIRKVRVYSCGKKQMVLEDLSGDGFGPMRGQQYSPNMKLFATPEDAIEYFGTDIQPHLFKWIREGNVRNRRIYQDHFDKHGGRRDYIDAYDKAIAMLDNGEITIEFQVEEG